MGSVFRKLFDTLFNNQNKKEEHDTHLENFHSSSRSEQSKILENMTDKLLELHKGNEENALELVKKGLLKMDEKGTTSADEFHQIGVFFSFQGKHKKAIEFYDKALALDSQNNSVWHSKGSALLKLVDKENALKCFDEALKIAPTIESYYMKGFILNKLAKYDEAIDCLNVGIELGIEIEPQIIQLLFQKAEALNQLDRYEEALKCLTRILNIKKDDPDFLYSKGAVLYNLGKYKEALPYFKKSLKLLDSQSPTYSQAKLFHRLCKENL